MCRLHWLIQQGCLTTHEPHPSLLSGLPPSLTKRVAEEDMADFKPSPRCMQSEGGCTGRHGPASDGAGCLSGAGRGGGVLGAGGGGGPLQDRCA